MASNERAHVYLVGSMDGRGYAKDMANGVGILIAISNSRQDPILMEEVMAKCLLVKEGCLSEFPCYHATEHEFITTCQHTQCSQALDRPICEDLRNDDSRLPKEAHPIKYRDMPEICNYCVHKLRMGSCKNMYGHEGQELAAFSFSGCENWELNLDLCGG